MFALLTISDWHEHANDTSPTPRLLAYLIHWQHDWLPGSNADKPLDLSDKPLFFQDDLPLRAAYTYLFESERSRKKFKT